ncbi:MAG: bifunctional phosphopantothenoylcysteine decarboxylase/phosphopantothenate--cysteine ligase CoaBC [Alphaproteobacteria bacterium]|nr:bifunctional phosphopantothenoylcysteine decarboxylase/phosphopantothenate--cysteine ligase CoaBC [Alphaproteobacteria bacterium]
MASLTIRGLDEGIKDYLRLRSARHNRSVEEEMRVILRDMAGAPASDGSVATEARCAEGGRITLIIGGGIAAYKSLDLIRRLRERKIRLRCVLTAAAQHFVTPLAVAALCHERVHTDLFDPGSEFDAGHIRLARECDLIVVAPATADLMAKMANGHADDLASAILLAANRPILVAPAMNPQMWNNPATRRNLARLEADGITRIGPNSGEMAERGEAGLGRMAEPLEIAAAALALMSSSCPSPPGFSSLPASQATLEPLRGRRVLITAGPTHEPIDPVRYIANRSSGRQGFAIAAAAHAAGAEVVLVTGPVELADPPGVRVVHVEQARDMLREVWAALPVDVAIFAAAVADWRVVRAATQKMKKTHGAGATIELTENPDILATIAQCEQGRPQLVIGFAAETEQVLDHARAKLARKGCDWIVANDVSPGSGVMGGTHNRVHLLTRDSSEVEEWPAMTKEEVARRLIGRIAAHFSAAAQEVP